MATQPTNLPVPSESPRDLKFNAGKIDEFVTSLAQQYSDRFGRAHYTIEGLKQLVLNLGWNPVGSFQDGAILNTAGDIIQDESTGVWYRWDDIGSLPKTVTSGSTPASTGGVSEGKWQAVDVSDVLRKQISDPDGADKFPELQIARWRDEGDVRGWGCKCNGIDDDSDNFQLAVTETESADKSLFIPGKMRITKKITFTKPPQLRGFKYSPPVMGSFYGIPYAHTGCIIYSEVATGLCFDINPPSNNEYIRGLNIIDVHILARGAGVNGAGVRIANCGWGGYSRGLVIEGFKNGGLELSQLQDTLFDQLEILNCGTDNVVAALEIKNGSNLLAFNRIRIEANEFQMRIRNGMMMDFNASHFEQGDYPNASSGPEFEKINRHPSIVIQATQDVKFNGGFIFGATIQKQMSKYGIAASDCPFHVSVGGDCPRIDFLGVTMGFGYNSGRILEHHGDGKVQNCTGISWCTETYPIFLDGNIQCQNNSFSYTDNPTSQTLFLMAANYATIEGNIIGCTNSGSVNKLYGSLFALNSAKPILLGRNQIIISKRALFHDATLTVVNQGHDGSEQSAGGVINMRQHNPMSIINLYGGAGGAAPVTSIDNMSTNQKVTFCNNGTGPITIAHGGNIICKGGVSAVVPAGAFIEFMFNGNTGSSVEISRTF